MKTLKGIDGKLDKVWSELVKWRAGMKCEYCHAKSKPLNSHHIFSRSNRSVRWDPINGICLCVGHHTFSSGFSAHKTPTEFTFWLLEKKGDDWMTRLRLKAHSISKLKKFEKEYLLAELQKELDNLKTKEHGRINQKSK